MSKRRVPEKLIDACELCPMFWGEHCEGTGECLHLDRPARDWTITDREADIPDWCPLEEVCDE